MLHWGKGIARTAGLVAVLLLGTSQQASAAYLWLWYADGVTRPADMSCCDGIPSAFQCNYKASTVGDATTDPEVCKRQVQEYLDLWYADFNLVFTLSHPPTGDYYPLIITSDSSWCINSVANICSVTPDEAGVAFFNCLDNRQVAAYAFACGYSAHDCAVMIAHEHGHLVGLEHTNSTSDVMNPTVMPTATGFDDRDNRTVVDLTKLSCQSKQNSHQQMLGALGRWQGSTKPSPFAPTPDAGSPDVSPDVSPKDVADAATTDGAADTPSHVAVDAGVVVVLAGFDALARPPLPTVDASGAKLPKSGGGCSLTGQPRRMTGSAGLVMLLAALASTLTRGCGRRGRHASERLPCATPPPSPAAAPARDCR
jgi:hypothetical protein